MQARNRLFTVFSVQGVHHANEDRYTIKDIHEGLGLSYYAVYDGHGGNFVVDYVKENLHSNIARILLQNRKKRIEGKSPSTSSSAGEESEVDDGDSQEEQQLYVEPEEDEDILSALRRGFILTDKEVIEECRKLNDWSGSCACATLLTENIIYLANLGDSVAVVFQFQPNTKVITKSVVLSTPHKPKLEEKRIDAAGGWVSADGYVMGVLGCSRSLGDRELKYFKDFEKSGLMAEFQAGIAQKQRLAASQRKLMKPARAKDIQRQKSRKLPTSQMKCIVSPNPEVTAFSIDEEIDALLVIGSDGLWDYVLPKRSVELVNDAFSKNYLVEDVCQALVGAAQRAKSPDDITVIVIALYDNS